MPNNITQAVPAEVLAKALASLREARAALQPYLHPLTTDERASLPKMGDKSVVFVQKAAEYAQSLPDLMPRYLDVPALLVDDSVSRDLLAVYQEALSLTTDVDSTRMMAGSEGFTSALLVYSALQTAADQNQPGAQAAVSELEPRFARGSKRKAE